MRRNNKHPLLAPLVFLATFPIFSKAETLLIEWQYQDNVETYILYQDGQEVCQSSNPEQQWMECNVSLVDGVNSFTLTAIDALSGQETPHSAPYLIDSSSQNSTPNHPPIAAFNTDIITGYAPLSVHFDASLSSDSEGSISYHWDFNDGDASADISPIHTFDNPGSYNVTLSVTDEMNVTSLASKTIIVNAPPENSNPVDETNPLLPKNITFFSNLDSLADLVTPIIGSNASVSPDISFTPSNQGYALKKSSSHDSGFEIPTAAHLPTNEFSISFDFIPSHSSHDPIFTHYVTLLTTKWGQRTSMRFNAKNGGGNYWEWRFLVMDDNKKIYNCSSGQSTKLTFSEGETIPIRLEFSASQGTLKIFVKETLAASVNADHTIPMHHHWARNENDKLVIFKSGSHSSALDNLKISKN